MAAASDIDRLIEEGLTLYGGGDVDAALLTWERALAMDPGNEQLNSYVDYVRMNYELLTSSEPMVADGTDTPFGIEEEPEYQIEILPGEMPAPMAPMHMDHQDEGWFLDEAPTREASFMDRATSLPNTTLELEADEPGGEGVSFEDATREYHGPAAEFGSGHQVATLGHIIHSEGKERSQALLKKTFAALTSGGTIAIGEMIPNDDRTGPAFPLLFAVNMLVNTEKGDTFTFAEMSGWLQEAGFTNPRLVDAPSVSPLLLATKP